jgi:hypothetical protein
MESINLTWFLEDPIDTEHKNYILLDYLKKKSENLEGGEVTKSLREISQIVKVLKCYKKDSNLDSISNNLSVADFQTLEKRKIDPRVNEVLDIVESSLDILYEFSEICLEILKSEQDKIKIFKLESKFSKASDSKNSGILLVRNMITEEIVSYFWKESLMKNGEESKKVIILKRIRLRNKKFSLSYEHIYHEVLGQIEGDKNFTPSFHIIEIYEDFSEKSDIFRLAKEKFIETLSYQISD